MTVRKKPKSVRDKILAYLQKLDARSDASPKEIADATGLPYDNVRQYVRRMVRYGEIEISSEGRYCHSGSVLARDRKQFGDPGVGALLYQCLRRLEDERRDPHTVAMAGLDVTLDYMVRRCGVDWARERIKEFDAGLETTLRSLEDLYGSKDDKQSVTVTEALHQSSRATQNLPPDECPIIVFGRCLWPIIEGESVDYNFNEMMVACWYARAANVLNWKWTPAQKTTYLGNLREESEFKGLSNALSAFFSAYEGNPKGECEFPSVPPNFAIKPQAGISDMTVLASFIRSRKHWPVALLR